MTSRIAVITCRPSEAHVQKRAEDVSDLLEHVAPSVVSKLGWRCWTTGLGSLEWSTLVAHGPLKRSRL